MINYTKDEIASAIQEIEYGIKACRKLSLTADTEKDREYYIKRVLSYEARKIELQNLLETYELRKV